MSRNESHWVRLSQAESSWVALSCAELRWVALSCAESNWVKLSQAESSWVALSRAELCWVMLSCAELCWVALSHAESSWVELSRFARDFHTKNQTAINCNLVHIFFSYYISIFLCCSLKGLLLFLVTYTICKKNVEYITQCHLINAWCMLYSMKNSNMTQDCKPI